MDIEPLVISYEHIATLKDMRQSRHVAAGMEIYNKAFPHGARSLEEFEEIIALNNVREVQRRWGDPQYRLTLACNERTGETLGLAAYMILPAPRNKWQGLDRAAVVFIDYRAVDENARGMGLAGKLEDAANQQAQKFLMDSGRIPFNYMQSPQELSMTCNETSIPWLMPLRAYLEDISVAKTDPCNRFMKWNRDGLLRLLPSGDVPFYVEPSATLTGGIVADECLYYSFNGRLPDGTKIPATTLISILEPWAAIRRCYGHDPRRNERFAIMVDNLQRAGTICSINDTANLKQFKPLADELVGAFKNLPSDDPRMDRSMISLLQAQGIKVPAFV